MTDPDNSNQLAFGQFQLDLGKRELRRDGLPVKLRSRAFDILCVLAQAEGKVVTKAELMAEIWPGVIVEDSNIQVHVSNLRPTEKGSSSLFLAADTACWVCNRGHKPLDCPALSRL
jgi:DNA-binding winged helix-turn-helix (wHTH) protein